ncbi:hypothetical protein [Streptomyces palmae]|uniref:Uncharacterized protein n=1 Tax=Streptomyces palmae TaxID=1701085 RepID=A0A4Z0GGI8_9ACTN|nr:hypothetical protein [Streptomyces palmae]TGA95636.1 hypothetical protein E4099_24950 [Streptomyces palmae]
MLSLRLARDTHPLVLLRRLLVALASASAGFLLLCTLGYAMAHPQRAGGSAARLLWCVVPLAATVQFAVAVARIDRGTRDGRGLAAAGFGPARRARLAAASTAVTCALGSALALAGFLGARRYGRPPSLADDLGRGVHVPLGAVLLLLGAVPALAAVSSAVSLWPRRARPPRPKPPEEPETEQDRPSAEDPESTPRRSEPIALDFGLPWGAALVAAGLAVETYAGRGAGDSAGQLLPLPGHPVHSPPGVLGGWVLVALGLMAMGPGLTQVCGRLLAAFRPGPLRLLAGRALEADADRLGRPLGVLCAVATTAYAVVDLYGDALGSAGPVAGLGAGLVMACVTATTLVTALEVRGDRADTTATLLSVGASARLLRGATALRTGALLAMLAVLCVLIAELLTLPLTG